MRRLTLLCVGVLLAHPASGQDPGLVFDAESGEPVPGAAVEWIPGEEEDLPLGSALLTDADGRFRPAAGWRSGSLTVSALGYRTRSITGIEADGLGWRISLEPEPVLLEEIVVTVGARARARSEVAVPVRTLATGEIKAAGAPSVDRLLAKLPGLESFSTPPTGTGIRIRGIGGARVLVLIDGRPAPGALIEKRDLGRLTLAGVERVELVKGPLSSLYGSDALGGVVNVISRDPDPGFRVGARALTGTTGRREAEVTTSGGGSIRYRAIGSVRAEDEVPGLALAPGEGFARVWDLRSELRYRAGEVWDFRAGLDLLRERQRWPVGGGFSGFNDNMGSSGWVEARGAVGRGELTLASFTQGYEHLYRSARGDLPLASSDAEPQRERETRMTVSYSVALGDHEIDIGIEGSRRTIESPDKLVKERVGDGQTALFAQDAWRVGNATVTGGARLGWNSRWGSNLSPSLGLVLPADENLRFRASWARGFRAPSFKELTWQFVNLAGGYVLRGSSDLRPERSWNFSGGAEWQPNSGVRIESELFWNQVDDLVENSFVGNAASGLLIYSPVNISEVTTRGAEVNLLAHSRIGLFRAGYAYLDARSRSSGRPLDRRPSHSARLQGTWVIDPSVRIDATGHLTGDAPVLGLSSEGSSERIATQERLTAFDLRISLTPGPNLELSFGVNNLFDARPEGWQVPVERRFRVGLEARELFARR